MAPPELGCDDPRFSMDRGVLDVLILLGKFCGPQCDLRIARRCSWPDDVELNFGDHPDRGRRDQRRNGTLHRSGLYNRRTKASGTRCGGRRHFGNIPGRLIEVGCHRLIRTAVEFRRMVAPTQTSSPSIRARTDIVACPSAVNTAPHSCAVFRTYARSTNRSMIAP